MEELFQAMSGEHLDGLSPLGSCSPSWEKSSHAATATLFNASITATNQMQLIQFVVRSCTGIFLWMQTHTVKYVQT